MLPFLLALHVLAATFWVGGMAFAHSTLRPAAGALDPAVRLPLWRRVFGRFFPLVGVSVAILLLSGFAMLFLAFGGFRGAALHIHLMTGTGIVMALLFLVLIHGPWRRFRAAVDGGALPEAAKHLHRIRRIVEANLVLGILTIVIGATGRHW